jgi:hypothetical protein
MTKPRLIATVSCRPYSCEADVYIEEGEERHLIVQYGPGDVGKHYLGTASSLRGPACASLERCPTFGAIIPDDMGEEEIVNRWLLWPMNPKAPYPKWEVPARAYGSDTLFRWWRGEKAA